MLQLLELHYCAGMKLMGHFDKSGHLSKVVFLISQRQYKIIYHSCSFQTREKTKIFEERFPSCTSTQFLESFLAGRVCRNTYGVNHIVNTRKFIPLFAIEKRSIAYDCEQQLRKISSVETR